jgi:hypothetical protein
MQLLDLIELVFHDSLRFGTVGIDRLKPAIEVSESAFLILDHTLRLSPVGVNRIKLPVEVSEAAFLVLDNALRFGPILDNRVEHSLARFEEAGATFGLSCLRSRPY